jgi:hypothetical protein
MEGFVLRCPLVLTFHAPHENARPYRATSEIVALRRWIEPHKIVYIPHGIDTVRFRPLAKY